MPTLHIEAENEDVAKIVLMPGDPLRAKYIADNFLEDVKQINKVRNMFGYTGYYKGTRVTVMGSGMGMPSMGIYSYELYKFYNVEKIIRIGSCGSYKEDIKVLDILLVDKSYTESNFAYTMSNSPIKIEEASCSLTEVIENRSKELNINATKATIMTADCFDAYIVNYKDVLNRIPQDINVVAVEMEAFALFHVAKLLGKEAACLLTVSDSIVTKEKISSEERETSLNTMIKLALESI